MTGLHLHLSQRIEALAGELAERIERERTGDPFIGSQVAVGSQGMKRWLSRSLALRAGITANVRFSSPTQLFGQAITELGGESAEGRAFEPASLRFDILALMRELQALPEGHDLAQFCEGDAANRAALGMARSLADSADRLVHYRPRLLWEDFSGELAQDFAGEPALALMRELFARLEARHGEAHLVARAKRLAGLSSSGTAWAPLHIFGVSFLPPIHFEILQLLAERRSVHLYAVVPSKEYFADTASKLERWKRELEGTFDVDLPILAGWGKLSRELLLLTYSLDAPLAEEQLLFDESSESASLLGAIQRDLLELREKPSEGHAVDDSVELHACFGPLRQVEALRERLLAAFSADPTLMPWEVAVLTPQIEVYGPLVRAAFSSEREGLPAIPVELADVSLVRRAAPADFLLRFVRFAVGRPTATALADLLEHRAAAPRFGFGDGDLPLVRELLTAAAMRYGEEDSRESPVPVSPIHTLRAGLRRITLGALYPDGAPEIAGLAPLPGLDGDPLRVGLALAEAIEIYLAHRQLLRGGPRTVDEWVDALAAVLTEVFPQPQQHDGLDEVLRSLGALRREASGFEGTLTLDAIAHEVSARFEELGERVHAHRGGVVVSRLAPMRAVPYRVLVLLGLDEASFPRREKQPSFDLVAKKPKAGDRDASSESRHLLLEALLAARERLLIFYDGRDPRTLEAIPPPTALEDLLETLSLMTGTPRDPQKARDRGLNPLVVEHPLQPFGAFAPHVPEAARSHSPAMREAAASALGERNPPPGPFPSGASLEVEEPDSVALADLIRFFRAPQRTLLERRLRARHPDEAASLHEREPLELDHLDVWGIRDELLQAQLAGDEGAVDALLARQRAEGVALAHGLDEIVVEAQWRRVEGLLASIPEGIPRPSPEPIRASVEVDVEVSGGRRVIVTGEALAPSDGQLVHIFASSRVSAHRKVSAMLEAVCLTLAREPYPVERVNLFFESSHSRFGLVPDPARWLSRVVEIYLEGRARALPLFSEASHELASAYRKTHNDLGSALAASARYFGSWNGGAPAEAESPAARLLFPRDPFFDWPDETPNTEARELAVAVFGPILEAEDAERARGKRAGEGKKK